MAVFTLSIDLGNDAFQDNAAEEVARILHRLAGRISVHGSNGYNQTLAGYTLNDINGAKVGETDVVDEDEIEATER